MKTLLAFVMILLTPAFLFGGDGRDTVPAGIITVRRPLVKADITVRSIVFYPDSSRRSNMHVAKVSRHEILMSDTLDEKFPPKVFDPAHYGGDFNPGTVLKYYPADSADYALLFRDLDFYFSYADTVKSDSARFEIIVRKDGTSAVKPLPWKQMDTSSVRLQNTAKTEIQKHPYWFPARRHKKPRSRKMKRVDSVIILVVYARDPAYGRLLPMEIIDK
ncbi:MAG TPA: hypothetical protein VFU15_12230 [Bacteroidia bacterium]|nr:hypothetical protein [Bacteroidia bacterium]